MASRGLSYKFHVLIIWAVLGCIGERLTRGESVRVRVDETMMIRKTDTNRVESHLSNTTVRQEVTSNTETSGAFTTGANIPGFCRGMMQGMELRDVTLSKRWPISEGTLLYMKVRKVSLGEETMLSATKDHLVIHVRDLTAEVAAVFEITTSGELYHEGAVICDVSGGGFTAKVPLNCNGQQSCEGHCDFDDSLNMIVNDIDANSTGTFFGKRFTIPKGFYESVMKHAVGSAVSRIGVTQAAMAAIEQGMCTKVLQR